MQFTMSNCKMKSLLKGLRYISQVFESEKEEEIEIGNPTDVKHVAHIGWDGPSANATTPSWMTEFNKSGGALESGEGGGDDDVSSVKCMSECGGRSKNLPKLPKSTRKSASEKGSPTKEKSSDKTKRRTSNKGGTSRRSKEVSEQDDLSSLPHRSTGLPEVPKKSRRKKKTTKEAANVGGSSRSTMRYDAERRSDADNMSDYMSETGSVRSMPQFDNRYDF